MITALLCGLVMGHGGFQGGVVSDPIVEANEMAMANPMNDEDAAFASTSKIGSNSAKAMGHAGPVVAATYVAQGTYSRKYRWQGYAPPFGVPAALVTIYGKATAFHMVQIPPPNGSIAVARSQVTKPVKAAYINGSLTSPVMQDGSIDEHFDLPNGAIVTVSSTISVDGKSDLNETGRYASTAELVINNAASYIRLF